MPINTPDTKGHDHTKTKFAGNKVTGKDVKPDPKSDDQNKKQDQPVEPPREALTAPADHPTLENPNPGQKRAPGQPAITGHNPNPVVVDEPKPSKQFAPEKKEEKPKKTKPSNAFSDKWTHETDPNRISAVLGQVNVTDTDYNQLKVASDNNGAYHAVYGSRGSTSEQLKDNAKYELLYERGDIPDTFDK